MNSQYVIYVLFNFFATKWLFIQIFQKSSITKNEYYYWVKFECQVVRLPLCVYSFNEIHSIIAWRTKPEQKASKQLKYIYQTKV